MLVETELFPRGAIEFYTTKNMGWPYTQEEADKWLMQERGGDQGDYRDGMQAPHLGMLRTLLLIGVCVAAGED